MSVVRTPVTFFTLPLSRQKMKWTQGAPRYLPHWTEPFPLGRQSVRVQDVSAGRASSQNVGSVAAEAAQAKVTGHGASALLLLSGYRHSLGRQEEVGGRGSSYAGSS